MKNCSFFLFVCLYYYFSCSRKASYFGSNISEVGDHYKRMSFPFSADFAKQEEQGAGKVFLLTKRRGNVLRHFLLSFYWRDAPPPPPPATCTSLPRTLQFSLVLHFYRWVIKLREEKAKQCVCFLAPMTATSCLPLKYSAWTLYCALWAPPKTRSHMLQNHYWYNSVETINSISSSSSFTIYPVVIYHALYM